MPTRSSKPVLVSVRRPMNDHDSMTVEVQGTNETRHLVEYADDRLRDTLAALPTGTLVPLELVRLGTRANVWKVIALHGRQTTHPNQSVLTAE